VKNYTKTYKNRKNDRNIRKIRINTHVNRTEKIHEKEGKKSAKIYSDRGSLYKWAPPTAGPHTFGGFRDYNIFQTVWVFTMNFPLREQFSPLTSTRRLGRASRAMSPCQSPVEQDSSGLPSAAPRSWRPTTSTERGSHWVSSSAPSTRTSPTPPATGSRWSKGEQQAPAPNAEPPGLRCSPIWKSSSVRVRKFSSVTIRSKNLNTSRADAFLFKLRNKTSFRFAW